VVESFDSHEWYLTAKSGFDPFSDDPFNRITEILKDERSITGDTAIRLGTFFKTSAEFWMNLQMAYDLRNAEKALPARVRKSIEDNKSVLA
jgi:plasmid maintenance system antidote protein VapI